MQLTTIDSIVRTYIHERGLVFHDYFRLLTLALSAVKEISMDINICSSVKAQYIDVDQSGAGYFPADAIEIIKVCIELGDKIYPMSPSDYINPIQKFKDGNPVKRSVVMPVSNYQLGDWNYYWANRVNEKGEFLGREYGRPDNQPFLYEIFDNRIQLDSRLNIDCVLIVYTTNGVKMSDINMVHPYAEEAIKAFIHSRFEGRMDRKGVYQEQYDLRKFFNEKRKLNARLNGLTYQEYISTIRDTNVMTIK